MRLEKIREALRRGITWQDAFAYGAIVAQRHWSQVRGTLALRCKAALFGVKLGEGVTACGPVIIGRWPCVFRAPGHGMHPLCAGAPAHLFGRRQH